MAVKTSSKAPGARVASERRGSGPRFAAIALTGLGVLVIAACAVLLSYSGIYQIARQGNIDRQYAHLYPGTFTLLLLMAFWTSYLLRAAPRSRRLWVDALILTMILLAAGASTLHALDRVLLPSVAVVVTAVAPWAALLVAFRIFLWVWMHLRGEIPPAAPRSRRGAHSVDGPEAPEGSTPAPHPLDSVGWSEGEDAEGLRQEESAPRGGAKKAAATGPALLWPRSQEARDSVSAESTVRVLKPTEVEELQAEVTTPLPTPPAAPAAPAAPEPEPEPEPDIDPVGRGPYGEPEPLEDAHTVSARSTGPAADAAGDTEASQNAEGTGEVEPHPADERPATVITTPAGDLPKRTPRVSTNPIKKAAEAAPRMAGGTSATGSADAGGPSGTAYLEDGFVHDLPVSDPISDEADVDLLPAADTAPDGHGRSGPAADAADAVDPAPSAKPAVAAAPPIEKRPVVLKPRRTPMSGLPSDPPSHHVRSEPTPPQE